MRTRPRCDWDVADRIAQVNIWPPISLAAEALLRYNTGNRRSGRDGPARSLIPAGIRTKERP